jgi:16S rRNA (guanine527-N7)-methyltransferase
VTEDDAQSWIKANFDVSRETWERLEAFVAFVRRESHSQNLIAQSTIDHIWQRHIVDSAQLLKLLPRSIDDGPWLDLGAGAGFPGIVTAILSKHKTVLVESRTKRIDYLHRAVEMLDLEAQIDIAGMTVERLQTAEFAIISARAFAPLPKLLDLAARFSTNKTHWLLPKGRNAAKELNECNMLWSLAFEIRPSVTDEEAGILVGCLLHSSPKSLKIKANIHD